MGSLISHSRRETTVLASKFLLGEYGAIAALSATRLTYGAANAEFDKDLFESLFQIGRAGNLETGFQVPTSPTVGHIVANAKISFLTRIRNTQWISRHGTVYALW